LLGWIAENRARLLAGTLTLVRAWHAAGRPQADVPPFGSFEEWANTVGGILAFAGVEGFLGNLSEVYATADTESAQWEAFLSALSEEVGDKTFTIAELVERHLPYPGSDLPKLLPEYLADCYSSGLGSFQHKLGRAFSTHVERRFGDAGYYLERAKDDTHTKVARWRVSRSA
jgi:hypothetical protein